MSALGDGWGWSWWRTPLRRPGATVAGASAALTALLALLVVPVGHAGEQRSDVEVDRVPAPAQAPAPADDIAASPAGVLPAGRSWSVTLLTGEVVDVRSDAEGRVTAVPRDQVAQVRTVQEPDGDLFVIPLPVTPLVGRVLDLELFNVTGLIRQGYDDASTGVVPLIVQPDPGSEVASTSSTLSTTGPGQRLPSIGAVATDVAKADAEATGAQLAELSAATGERAGLGHGIARVWLDRRVTTASAAPPEPAVPAEPAELDSNLTQVGADRAWAAGFEGEGTTVAVLDTGIDAQHPDLAGRVVAEENFTDSPDTGDHVGHGTHVAAIVAGTGAAAGGARRGVAPDAELINGKVLDDLGGGAESGVIAGMEWAAPRADVVNMSVGLSVASDGDDPMSLALDALTERHGTLFVVAAGNSGSISRSVEVPGAADRALTVGAVDSGDVLADFSSRGPLPGSYELKPEVVAPGVDIVAARAAGTRLGDPVGDGYIRMSGTSMATPHVAGAAALLAQQHPAWSADQLKSGLVASSDPIEGDGYGVGAGRVDIGDGTAARVGADRDVVDLALPHPRSQPDVTTLSWTNRADAPQTVVLDAVLEDRRGAAVDAVAITPRQLTLAPGATGTATLQIDSPDLDDGLYRGTVVADPAGGTDQDDLRTPVAVHAGSETADLTVQATPPAGGDAVPSTFAAVVNLDDYGEFSELLLFDDTTTVTVPVGRYSVLGDVSVTDGDAYEIAQVGDPDLTITRDTTVSFDGAAAVRMGPTVEGIETAPPVQAQSVAATIPALGTDGLGLLLGVSSTYPSPPPYVTPMQVDPDVFAAFQVFRLQAPHITARAGHEVIDVTSVRGRELTPGDHTLRAVDAPAGDLTVARGELAVVRLPEDPAERAAVTRRAADAGVAALAFVDEQRPHLALFVDHEDLWGEVPIVGVAGASATTLLSAAAAHRPVTITVQASRYVYDIVSTLAPEVEPALVIDRAAQRRLATLRERFHWDADGTGATRDGRLPAAGPGLLLRSEGPLPRRRTAHVTPGIAWQSRVMGPGLVRLGDELIEDDEVELSLDASRPYEAGSDTALTWLRRPMGPGPVGVRDGTLMCESMPASRTRSAMRIWLAPFQDGRDRFGCAAPRQATLVLERDGTVIGSADSSSAELPVPAEAGTYQLSYQQTGAGPYPHDSATTWTFDSVAPDDPAIGEEPLPLLVVDYELPLDTRNRPTSRTARFTVHQVTGAEQHPIRSLQVWTSTGDSTTWRRAPVRRSGDGTYQVTLPRASRGTPVSLRVDARDTAGNRLEQTLDEAYTA